MKYIEIRKKFLKESVIVKKQITMKILKDAGFAEEYCDESLWFECTEIKENHCEFIATNFKFEMHIDKNGLPSTHIIDINPTLKLNSNSNFELKEEYIKNMIKDINTAQDIIISLIKNKEFIAKTVYDLYYEMSFS